MESEEEKRFKKLKKDAKDKKTWEEDDEYYKKPHRRPDKPSPKHRIHAENDGEDMD